MSEVYGHCRAKQLEGPSFALLTALRGRPSPLLNELRGWVEVHRQPVVK